MKTRISQQHSLGFSLVETLVAISILLLVIIVPLRIASQSILSSAFSRQEMTAVFLAEESTEAIVRLRDNDALDGGSTTSWYSSLPATCKTSTGCSYNVSTGSFVSCSPTTSCDLYASTSGSSYYTHTSNGTTAVYNRKTVVTESPTGEYNVTSTVSWTAGVVSGVVSVAVTTRIYNQYE
ncbi:hypothetical protein GW943_00720 [Candidatus Parcubacteria bacterium]|uniref:Type II secretion system protein GspI C-terminal domain-containing protein n=1 Tax=Candidatus Kaiserbacteria bacterium CG10_big_fil_rev_8_21_14_0_10_47_16 TaxID=1974608 RepID=A0A2H0UD61_9BACT|nr:hypothetical protein [Candidatus Parcubacteria bacterium]PIR84363.1 MAG: hypothetical protein COU16_02105 [Candidatus Kaiserbacteria bacterium CG10_big_fil_rev_8_21_14_0_10_47_16]